LYQSVKWNGMGSRRRVNHTIVPAKRALGP
jgi:hypothetical protein